MEREKRFEDKEKENRRESGIKCMQMYLRGEKYGWLLERMGGYLYSQLTTYQGFK